jgi:hypothetical protein
MLDGEELCAAGDLARVADTEIGAGDDPDSGIQ